MMNDFPAGLKRNTQEAVEIRLWETYLVRSRNNLYKTLANYSLDRGPIQKIDDFERLSFRFMRYDWDKTVQMLLADNAVPYELTRSHRIDVVQHLTKKEVHVAEEDLNLLLAVNAGLEQAGYDEVLQKPFEMHDRLKKASKRSLQESHVE